MCLIFLSLKKKYFFCFIEMSKLSNLTIFIRAAKKMGVHVLPGAEKLTDDVMIPCLLQVVAFAKKAWEVQIPNAIAKRIEESDLVAEAVADTSIRESSPSINVAQVSTPPPIVEEAQAKEPPEVEEPPRRASIASQSPARKDSVVSERKASIVVERKVSAVAERKVSTSATPQKKVSFPEKKSMSEETKPRSKSKGKQNGQACMNLLMLFLLLLLLWMLFSSSSDDRNRRY